MSIQPWDLPAPEPALPLPNALGLSVPDWRDRLLALGEKSFRAQQLFEGLHRQRWTTWEAFSTLPKSLRTTLQHHFALDQPVIRSSHASLDGSTKHAFQLADGLTVEGVHMPYEDRTTLCISSQVGCAMGCTFCATGQLGIQRNLSTAEIVGQVYAMLGHHAHPEGRPVNLVFMGMGEPLHNLGHVMSAFDLLTHPDGLAIPPRRITVSTSGLVTGIQRLGTFPRRPRLAVSLNATTDEARSRIMPVNRIWNLDRLAQALAAFPLEPHERITLEYVLLAGVTDTPEDEKRLIAFARRFPAKINLIPFNTHEGAGFQPPSEARIDELGAALAKAGITVMVRRSRGQDVAGACGQLARKGVSQP